MISLIHSRWVSNTESKAEGRGVGLALCKSVVEAHDGSISAQSNGKKRYYFPFCTTDVIYVFLNLLF